MDNALIDAQGVSKILCRSLKRSIWYGVRDIASELFGRRRDRTDCGPRSSTPSGTSRSRCDAASAWA